MHQVLVHTHKFGLKVPLSDGAVEARSHEVLLLSRMPFAVSDCSYMALSIGHILYVHVTTNGHDQLGAIFVIDTRLVVSCTAKELCTIRIKGERIDRMPLERLELSH
jgi:hypothetical protein